MLNMKIRIWSLRSIRYAVTTLEYTRHVTIDSEKYNRRRDSSAFLLTSVLYIRNGRPGAV